jgi:4-hydroxymandelate synthase
MQGIHSVEFYVHDDQELIRYLAQLGFTLVTGGGRSDDKLSKVLQDGPVRLVVSTPAAASSAVAAWLAVHGDGVADIRFSVRSVLDALDRAVRARAEVLQCPGQARVAGGQGDTRTAVIGGVGGVHHTLLEAPLAPAGPGRAEALDHVALCVPSHAALIEVANRYANAFGLTWTPVDRVVFGGGQSMDTAVLDGEGCTFTIVAPGPGQQRGQLERFLDANPGPGVQHIAIRVTDIVAEVHRASERGARFLPAPPRYYKGLLDRLGGHIPPPHSLDALRAANVLADGEPGSGALWQIFTEPLWDSPFFCELIERRRSRGFGGNNIRALFEAKHAAEVAASPFSC